MGMSKSLSPDDLSLPFALAWILLSTHLLALTIVLDCLSTQTTLLMDLLSLYCLNPSQLPHGAGAFQPNMSLYGW